MLAWKNVGVSKVSVIYIYIYILGVIKKYLNTMHHEKLKIDIQN